MRRTSETLDLEDGPPADHVLADETGRPGWRQGPSGKAYWTNVGLPIFALTGLGIAQPMLTIAASNSSTILFSGSERSHVVAFAALVTLGPTAALTAALMLTVRFVPERAAEVARFVTLAVAALFPATSVLVSADVVSPLDALGGLVAAGAIARALTRFSAAREIVRLIAIVPAIVVAVFFANSGATPFISASPDPPPLLASTADTPPVIVLILDELPIAALLDAQDSRSIDRSLFPNLARFSDEAHWYPNALSNGYETVKSLPAAVTGRVEPGLASYHVRDESIFTALEPLYETHALEPITRFCAPRECEAELTGAAPLRRLLLDVGLVWAHSTAPEVLARHLPILDARWGGFLDDPGTDADAAPALPASDLTNSDGIPGDRSGPTGRVSPAGDAALVWAGSIERLGRAVADVVESEGSASGHFWWHHVPTPHAPWRVLPSGRHYPTTEPSLFSMDGLVDGAWIDHEPTLRIQRQRQLAQLMAVDAEVGVLIDELERSGAWDEALVLVMSDHGSSFDAGNPRRDVTEATAPDVYRVPLLVHEPGQETGFTHEEPVFLADVAPTILKFVGLDPGWEMEGIDLLGELPTDRAHRVVAPDCCLNGGVTTDIEALGVLVDERTDAIGFPRTAADLFSAGPLGALVHQPVATLDEISSARLASAWTPDQADHLSAVVLDSGIVPAYLSGPLPDPSPRPGQDLLVLVNGVVAGSGYAERDRDRIVVFAHEGPFRDGPNMVSLAWQAEDDQWWLTSPTDPPSGWDPEVVQRPTVTVDGTRSAIRARATESAEPTGRWSVSVEALTLPETARPFEALLVDSSGELLDRGPIALGETTELSAPFDAAADEGDVLYAVVTSDGSPELGPVTAVDALIARTDD